MSRNAAVTRVTKETDIQMNLELDGSGKSTIDTGIGFFDHMLEGFSKHGFFDLDVVIKGDLDVDGHHTVEDAGIVLGSAIKEAVGDKKGIKRYGYFILPMDDALALCAVDLPKHWILLCPWITGFQMCCLPKAVYRREVRNQ